MEHPNPSFANSIICSQEPFSPSEESGWTSYFDDFLASEKRKTAELASETNLCVGSSLVSDASWKPQISSQAPLKSCNKLNLMKKKKKKKTRIVSDDDSLEDTATSPINSPKMADDGEGNKDLHKGRIEEMSYVGRAAECS